MLVGSFPSPRVLSSHCGRLNGRAAPPNSGYSCCYVCWPLSTPVREGARARGPPWSHKTRTQANSTRCHRFGDSRDWLSEACACITCAHDAPIGTCPFVSVPEKFCSTAFFLIATSPLARSFSHWYRCIRCWCVYVEHIKSYAKARGGERITFLQQDINSARKRIARLQNVCGETTLRTEPSCPYRPESLQGAGVHGVSTPPRRDVRPLPPAEQASVCTANGHWCHKARW